MPSKVSEDNAAQVRSAVLCVCEAQDQLSFRGVCLFLVA